MISFLSQWLKQIILLVLVATFLDLIIPNSSFERYIKLVVGLLIITIMLSPIISLLNKDLTFSQDVFNDNFYEKKGLNLKNQSEKFKEKQQDEIKKLAEKKLESKIKSSLLKEFPIEVFTLNVELDRNCKNISHIFLVVKIRNSYRGKNEILRIEPVKPVQVLTTKKEGVSENTTEIEKKLLKYFKEKWHVLKEHISLQVAF